MRHARIPLTAVALALLCAGCGKGHDEARTSAPNTAAAQAEFRQLANEVFVYAYPLVLMDVTRQVMAARAQPNTFSHMRAYPDHTFTDVVSPNADTLYSTAWLDLSREPVVLSVPAMARRYYLMPMLDAWTNVFASPGTRTTGNGPGRYAIVGPHWHGELPADVKEIKAPTDMVWIIGRTQTHGPADYAQVRKLQNQYQLVPLSSSGTNGTQNEGQSAAPTPPAAAGKRVPPVEQVAAMGAQTFFSRFAGLLAANPPSSADASMVEKMTRLGIRAGASFDMARLDPATQQAIEAGTKAGLRRIAAAAQHRDPASIVNGWVVTRGLGSYGTDYEKRAFVAWVGLGANLDADAMYPMARTDSDGQPLSGANKYVVHFEKGQTPPVNALWSLTLYNERQAFVDNPLGRYAIGDRDKLKPNADGSLDLYIQHDSPGKDKESNWLPAPPDAFNLILRMYWPRDEALSGAWAPPPVQRST